MSWARLWRWSVFSQQQWHTENREQMGRGSRYPLHWQITESCTGWVQKPTCVSVLMECRTQGAICRVSVSRYNTCSEVTSCDTCRLSSKHGGAPGGDLRADLRAQEATQDRADHNGDYFLITARVLFLLHHSNFPMNECRTYASTAPFHIAEAYVKDKNPKYWNSGRFFISLDKGDSFHKC